MEEWWTPEGLTALMAIAKAKVSSRKAVTKALSDAPRPERATKMRRRKVRSVVAKLLLLGSLVAVDSTADPGIADAVLGDGPAIVCYATGPER